MCNASVINFASKHLRPEEVYNKDILEVGARDVNGSVRRLVERLGPKRYVGVDIANGPGVDEVCAVGSLFLRYGPDQFDIVISTEMLEHVRDWRGAINNMKGVLRSGGMLVLTTRSIGFGYHAHPFDFWRFEREDMRAIFSDFVGVQIQSDEESPGVFVCARKPKDYSEKDLSPLAMYSMIKFARCVDVSTLDIYWFRAKYRYWQFQKARSGRGTE